MNKELKIPKKPTPLIGLIVATFIGACIGSAGAMLSTENSFSLSGYISRYWGGVILIVNIVTIISVSLCVFYYKRYRYYDPKRRTFLITSPEQLIIYAGPEIMFYIYKRSKGDWLILQGDKGVEKFYLKLRFTEKEATKLLESINSFEAKYGTILAVNFTTSETGHAGIQSVHMKFWGRHDSENSFRLGSIASDSVFYPEE